MMAKTDRRKGPRLVSVPSPEPIDPWETGSTDVYSPDTYYTRATDSKGHSAKVSVKQLSFPPELWQLCCQIARERPEYDSNPHAFIRDAATHHYHRRMSDGYMRPTAIGAQVLALAEADLIRQFRENHRQVLAAIADESKALADAGDADGLEAYLDGQEALAERYHEPYRGQVAKAIKEARRLGKRAKKSS